VGIRALAWPLITGEFGEVSRWGLEPA